MEDYLNLCAWCKKRIRDNSPIYSVSCVQIIKHNIDLTKYEGQFIEFTHIPLNKIIPIYICPKDSPAKKDGKDFMVFACSDECTNSLQNILFKKDDISFLINSLIKEKGGEN